MLEFSAQDKKKVIYIEISNQDVNRLTSKLLAHRWDDAIYLLVIGSQVTKINREAL
jgi:hypothetical protein